MPQTETIRIEVYRDLSNRLANEPDDGKMAWDAHRLRRKTLHELFDGDPVFRVKRWDPRIDDEERTHEWGWLVVEVANWLGFTTVQEALYAFLSSVMEGVAVDAVIRGTGTLIAKLYPRMRKKAIGDAYIKLADETQIHLKPDGTVTVHLINGKLESFRYEPNA